MGRKQKFDRKQAVRFQLVPGVNSQGKEVVLYKPIQTKKSKLTTKERKKIIQNISDYDEITINGKVVDESEIPAYVLEQIRGRSDIVYNQIKNNEQVQECPEGDLYELQEGQEQDQEYSEEYLDEEEEIIEDEDEWIDDDQDQEIIDLDEKDIVQRDQRKKQYKVIEEDFPNIQQIKTIEIEGTQYNLTKKQLEILDSVIPEHYDELDFGGLKFKRYNQDGLLLSDKQKYQKYLLKENEKKPILDSYEYVPLKPIDTVDNDLKPNQIQGDVKEVQEALDYVGQQDVYDELEDDFFVKMIQAELKGSNKDQKKKVKIQSIDQKQIRKNEKLQKNKEINNKKQKVIRSEQLQKQQNKQLQQALYNFENNIETKPHQLKQQKQQDEDDESYLEKQHSMNFKQIERKQEYIGKDGQLDWRYLSKKQKRQYMKTKVITPFFDQLLERQIQQKIKGKKNISIQELHLKQRIRHIPFEEDHVMIKALQENLQKQNQDDDDENYEDLSSYSSDDDIVSYHQKTSIISNNLSFIEEPKKQKAKSLKVTNQETAQEPTRIKVIPEKRNKNETKQERKQRKQKLKQMKKMKKQQRKDFNQKFEQHRKTVMKKSNTNNTLNKVSLVKIY